MYLIRQSISHLYDLLKADTQLVEKVAGEEQEDAHFCDDEVDEKRMRNTLQQWST